MSDAPQRMKAIPKITGLREKVQLTQLELSQLVGVTETTIQNWEKGRAGVEQIERVIRLCKALDCEPEDLIEYVPAPASETKKSKRKSRLDRMQKLSGTDKPAQAASSEMSSSIEVK
ncbi:MAG: helix-turn-helix transcriptional regulator [Symploca sp. SIO3E6]|nr:helix-turn-helix transcriptional regulator [Caldora sp. SIO3E6]